jgi:hypothetical protein
MLRINIPNICHEDFAMMGTNFACSRHCRVSALPRSTTSSDNKNSKNIHDPRAKHQGKIMNFCTWQWLQTRRNIRPPLR